MVLAVEVRVVVLLQIMELIAEFIQAQQEQLILALVAVAAAVVMAL